jgi:alkanesulfonate monooxygenase SsuD/methylene tetrahydromethanopterin reductase-like flavin-dependent oxidoreductase (luciferase family)
MSLHPPAPTNDAAASSTAPRTLPGPNTFKLGLFGLNTDGGIAITKVPERWRARWDDIADVVRMADGAGFDFLLPIARWKGYGGETNVRNSCFETLTYGGALAAMTERLFIFSTVHVPVVHPVFAAKALSTIDHVSHGRAGLNIVCGWNQAEFDMFGLTQSTHDDRYAQGREWFEIVTRIFAEEGRPFDYKGRFYDLKGVSGEPPPVQRPRPLTMSAASSPAGRDFALATSDLLFDTFRNIEAGKLQLAAIAEASARAGRQMPIGVCTACHVVARETDAEAEAYYRHYAEANMDSGALDFHVGMTRANRIVDKAVLEDRVRRAAGLSTYKLVGTPERIADELIAIHRAGFAGTTISFVNFKTELPFFIERVMPLLRQAGLVAAPT